MPRLRKISSRVGKRHQSDQAFLFPHSNFAAVVPRMQVPQIASSRLNSERKRPFLPILCASCMPNGLHNSLVDNWFHDAKGRTARQALSGSSLTTVTQYDAVERVKLIYQATGSFSATAPAEVGSAVVPAPPDRGLTMPRGTAHWAPRPAPGIPRPASATPPRIRTGRRSLTDSPGRAKPSCRSKLSSRLPLLMAWLRPRPGPSVCRLFRVLHFVSKQKTSSVFSV